MRIASARGELVVQAKLDAGLPRGVAFAPFHWGLLHAPAGTGQLNRATHGAVDPVSRQPELKAAAVRIERLRRRTAAPTGPGEATGGSSSSAPAWPG